jgi:proton-dependent oligopeptide transporter, POT family
LTATSRLAKSSRDVVKVGRFRRVVWVALVLELLERLAFYGVYVNLAVYLTDSVRLSDGEGLFLMGVFTAVRATVPVVTGAASDRIGFRRSLAMSFALYILAYLVLFFWPSRPGAWAAVMGMAFAGAFLKPVVPATVRRYTAPDDRTMGFSYFYASVNLGSVIGKVATALVRTLVSLRASMINAVVACAVGLAATLGFFREPEPGETESGSESAATPVAPRVNTTPLQDLAALGKQRRLLVFLALIAGYYLLIEQFYQTFPIFAKRTLGDGVPREYITLINPAAIAVFQVGVGRLARKIPALWSMSLGGLIGAVSMLLMGTVPGLAGPCASFLVFAFAEMVFSPRYFEYVSSFAPSGREGLYMGLAAAPLGVGGLVGGILSGRLVTRYLPKEGPRAPLMVWGTYAAIGVVCSLAIAIYAIVVSRRRAALPDPA